MRLDKLIIDNFAGGGGTSTGLEQAFGRSVDVAINHDPKALAMHRANHPDTRHYCESVWDVDPRQVTNGKPVGLVWLSPDCKHFSKAKGSKPVDKKIRGLAWVALRWADLVEPDVIMLENVEEFKTWGRIGEDGKPCPKHKGNTFKSFVNAFRYQGYVVEWRVLIACDYGAPTTRRRFFLIARRDGLPIVWPKPTHARPDSKEVLRGNLLPWRTAAECIDWSIPCPSIFERKKPLAESTSKRVAIGLVKQVINNPDPFIVNETLAPVMTEIANASSPRCMKANEPLRTICASVKGGHHALVTAFIAKHYTGVVGDKDCKEPLDTITSKDHHSLVTGTIVKLRNNCVGQSVDEPLHTITASAGHFAAVSAFLTAFYGNEKDVNRVDHPLRTITTKDRFGLVMVKGVPHRITDIGLRMFQPNELFKAQGFPETYIFSYGVDESGQTIRLTKTEQTRMVGNSVPPNLAFALAKANFSYLTENEVCA
ncbi:DNA cytosine methyltransferase [Acinetobacter soli]|uniref:DNA cytosine methyltransferase n=1 Tax=Acinetobacter soli TaxID=487316 RepID=UPI002B290243|nr:DNA cytosine methyltransferase [Acinetobacter soli]